MKIALITLSVEGRRIAERLAVELRDAEVFVHAGVRGRLKAARFASVCRLTKEIFQRFDGLVFIAPCGVAVRAIAPWLQHKTTDPAVVVVDAGGRYAISLLSGHEGGANDLAFRIANLLGAEPVISTTTEAVKGAVRTVGRVPNALASKAAPTGRRR